MSDVNDMPDTGPADDQNNGGKPGDRPLPTTPAVDKDGNLRDLDAERKAREDIIRHNPQDDQAGSDDDQA